MKKFVFEGFKSFPRRKFLIFKEFTEMDWIFFQNSL